MSLLLSYEDLEKNENFTVVEVCFYTDSYIDWHIPNAIMLPWRLLRHPIKRDFASKEGLEIGLGSVGISNEDRLVLYSDLNNRYAFYAFWVLKAFGHKELYVLNGGKTLWEVKGLPKEREMRRRATTKYEANTPDWSDRVMVWEILKRLKEADGFQLLDVRYREEYYGDVGTSPEHPNEESQTTGHIPGAINVPWNVFFDEVTEELIPPNRLNLKIEKTDTVVYCRTGARASLVWFYLKYLLGFPRVRLYDGSWAEWGNMVGVPVER
ncbi:MAG: rhodanese-like domain-containing protein [Metallosphaera sp.]